MEALDALGGARFLSSMQIGDAGWVDGDALAAIYEVSRRRFSSGDPRFGDDVPSLWIVAAVELWFEAVFGCASSAMTPAQERAMM
jgi:hypothetical protein